MYKDMNPAYEWYKQLIKPPFAPPSWVFGPVWTVLYVIIAISFGYTGWLWYTKKIHLTVFLPFLLNLFFNIIFTPIQFGLRNNILAALDILLVDITLIWAMIRINQYAKWVSVVQLPYLSWGLFATLLQFSVTWLNW
jgi:translocator protein